MSQTESYIKPISLRNGIYSAIIIAVGCFGPWLFWRSAIPPRWTPPSRPPLTARYSPRTAGAMGVTWSSVPIGLPNRIGFDGAAQREDSKFQAFLTPPPLPVELGVADGDSLANRFGPVLEWADQGRPAPERYVPVPVEAPVFGPPVGRVRSPVEYEWMDALDGVRWISLPSTNILSNRPRGKPLSLTAWVELAPGGWVEQVMLESPSGRPDIDRVVLRGLGFLRAQPDSAKRSGRVRVSLAGTDSSLAEDKE